MKIVDRMPGKSRHPWEQWLDGQVRLLEPDIDFSTKPSGLISAAHNAAKARGVKISARIRPEGVYLQALDINKKPLVVAASSEGDTSEAAA